MLPKDIIFNGKLWKLHQYGTPEGNVGVEYILNGELFPVAFVMPTADEAQLLMLAWLVEQGIE